MEKYLDFKVTGDFKRDIHSYFLMYGREDTYEHTLDVVTELYNIKKQFGSIEEGSEVACYCHDLGRVVDKDEIIRFCIENNIEITHEEKQMPSILHQKISKLIAENVFGIENEDILNAVRYHTTSRRPPSKMEIEVLLADKLSWKEEGYEKLINEIREALKDSREKAILHYLTDLELNKETLLLYHKDSKEAYEYFRDKFM
ncbi:HD domain-containing protein [Tissierella pigra]|uniref:HD domain-containing protein n=1 Tax=Tissierella pigra TaxID=2607614 RepID=A0A6N7Y0B6_9FIRM|nr:HD domain-containing protein [Tissierella pigra]MBU5427493.1 HD domain-containing protein [Tissierella pigra]MSU03183.1 HD domain-containing protein [Tissierella pigra]